MPTHFEYDPPTRDPHIPDVRNCGCRACEIERLRAEVEQSRKDLKLSEDVLRMTAHREDELEAELADAHSAHATVAELLRQAYESQSDALDSPEMQTMPF